MQDEIATDLSPLSQVAREDDLKEQIGKSRYFDLVDHEKVTSFRVSKQSNFADFKKQASLS
eukprot:scaffold234004_cov38-Prasinocladus_malaysianus.AAC.1